jgi:hypothetical protein
MVVQLLVAPEMFSSADGTWKSSVAVSWNEVAIETCWMVLSLTAKDDDVVNVDHMIQVIVQLLSHSDMKTVVMALHLVNASFHRLNVIPERFRFRQLFEEFSILLILVC